MNVDLSVLVYLQCLFTVSLNARCCQGDEIIGFISVYCLFVHLFHKCKERDVLSVISSTDIIWSTWGRYLCLITVSLSEGHAAPHCSFSAAFHVEYKWNTDRWAFSGLIKDSHLMLLSATDRLIQAANTGGSKGLSGKFEAGDGGSQSKRFSADPRLSQGWLMSLEISKGTITKCTTGVLLQTEDITLSKFTFNVVL